MLRQPNGSGVIRLFGYVVAKVLRRAADGVTFDRTSFESALARVPNGTLLIIAPSHRSYMDFLLCSYLFFDQPGLGIAIPHIAAAKEFSRIPLLGHLFEKGQAFFIKRGMRRGDYVELTARITDLVKRRQTLQVFIEGTRSRSRQFLPPRHGLLKCIQETGQPATILPDRSELRPGDRRGLVPARVAGQPETGNEAARAKQMDHPATARKNQDRAGPYRMRRAGQAG